MWREQRLKSSREHPYKYEPPGRAVILRQIASRANPSVSAEIRELSKQREMARKRGCDREGGFMGMLSSALLRPSPFGFASHAPLTPDSVDTTKLYPLVTSAERPRPRYELSTHGPTSSATECPGSALPAWASFSPSLTAPPARQAAAEAP